MVFFFFFLPPMSPGAAAPHLYSPKRKTHSRTSQTVIRPRVSEIISSHFGDMGVAAEKLPDAQQSNSRGVSMV